MRLRKVVEEDDRVKLEGRARSLGDVRWGRGGGGDDVLLSKAKAI